MQKSVLIRRRSSNLTATTSSVTLVPCRLVSYCVLCAVGSQVVFFMGPSLACGASANCLVDACYLSHRTKVTGSVVRYGEAAAMVVSWYFGGWY